MEQRKKDASEQRKSKKRKVKPLSDDTEPATKRTTSSPPPDDKPSKKIQHRPLINMPSLKTGSILATTALPKVLQARETSAAIQSLYTSHQSEEVKGNWLTKGTFNRYAA
jgi:hypothetical protein